MIRQWNAMQFIADIIFILLFLFPFLSLSLAININNNHHQYHQIKDILKKKVKTKEGNFSLIFPGKFITIQLKQKQKTITSVATSWEMNVHYYHHQHQTAIINCLKWTGQNFCFFAGSYLTRVYMIKIMIMYHFFFDPNTHTYKTAYGFYRTHTYCLFVI